MKYNPTSKEFQRVWAKIVARAWTEQDFKQRLLEKPAEVLGEYGVEVPPGSDIRVDDQSGLSLGSGPEPQSPPPPPRSSETAASGSKGGESPDASVRPPPAGSLGAETASSLVCFASVPTYGTLAIPPVPFGSVARSFGAAPVVGGLTLGTVGSAGTGCGVTAGMAGAMPNAMPMGTLASFGPSARGGISCVGSAGSVGCVGSVGSVTGTAGSVGTAATVGTFGCKG